MEQEHVFGAPRFRTWPNLAEVDFDGPAPTLLRACRASMIDKNTPHLLAGQREEVSPVLYFERSPADEPQIRLIDQGSGLERMA